LENKGTNNMRKLLQTMLGAVALPTLSLAANAADIRVRRSVGLDSTSAATLVALGTKVT
jgi:hypothetical protein